MDYQWIPWSRDEFAGLPASAEMRYALGRQAVGTRGLGSYCRPTAGAESMFAFGAACNHAGDLGAANCFRPL